jgi:hypothetical protein
MWQGFVSVMKFIQSILLWIALILSVRWILKKIGEKFYA